MHTHTLQPLSNHTYVISKLCDLIASSDDLPTNIGLSYASVYFWPWVFTVITIGHAIFFTLPHQLVNTNSNFNSPIIIVMHDISDCGFKFLNIYCLPHYIPYSAFFKGYKFWILGTSTKIVTLKISGNSIVTRIAD